MMFKPVFGLIAACILSSCCIFGFTEESYEEWDNPAFSSNEVGHIRTACRAEVQKKRRDNEREFLNGVKQACDGKRPFADFRFANPHNGRPYTDARQEAMRQEMAADLCGELRHAGKISKENIQLYCAKCDSGCSSSDLEACYRAGGLRLVSKHKPACSPMPLF